MPRKSASDPIASAPQAPARSAASTRDANDQRRRTAESTGRAEGPRNAGVGSGGHAVVGRLADTVAEFCNGPAVASSDAAASEHTPTNANSATAASGHAANANGSAATSGRDPATGNGSPARWNILFRPFAEFFTRGNLHVRGYAGNDKLDRCAQVTLLRDAYAALGRRWSR